MKFPRKSFGMAAAVLAAAVVTSATALAKPPKLEMPSYFSAAADLSNAAYLACIKARIKSPAGQNILDNFGATLACQKDSKS